MFSFIKYVWDNVGNTEKHKRELQEKFEAEQRYFDEELKCEYKEKSKESYNEINNQNSPTIETDNSECFKKVGVITTIESDHGTIDNCIFFDIHVALGVSAELKVGCQVEYLAYQQQHTECIKVINILQIVDHVWDSEIATDEIEKKIADLRVKKPTYFLTHQRSILGLIVKQQKDFMLVDTDFKTLNIDMDKVEMDFIPLEGDRVYIVCNVQADEHFVDKHGEILEILSINPARRLKEENRTVQKVLPEWGILSENSYFTHDVVPNGCKLEPNDIVSADLIECDRGDFIWRAISLTVLKHGYADDSIVKTINHNENAENLAVVVSKDVNVVIRGLFQCKNLEWTVTNNRNHVIGVLGVMILGRQRDSQIELIEPKINTPFDLMPHSTTKLHFVVESKVFGESIEYFSIKFDKFRVKRSITLVVCETEDEAKTATENLAKKETRENSIYGRKGSSRQRFYANKVWATKGEVIPGVGLATKRRFVAVSIGAYEVPERLRKAYLISDSRQDMLDNIYSMFPYLKEELSINNYVSRFQTLLHLEEIECFLNFRSFDRDRAHFTREDEYLALTVENLAEGRPSLVIGDIVRAVNPWSDENSEQRSYDGIIHKVLFDRVLLKFNPGFQSKYNGEDYRLEFYFSRFGYRKQHFACSKVVQHLGERFLFPLKMNLRDKIQLNAELDDKENLIIEGEPSKWYNPLLNTVQKRAIRNILLGKVHNMPYVVFGPPGTGKTITLVEAILQLMHNVSSARIIVGTPSNSSADLICTRLIESGAVKPGDFIRLVSHNQVEKELIPKHLMPYCATCDFGLEGTTGDTMITTESGLQLRCQKKYLGRHRITISTCNTLGCLILMGFPSGHFTHIVIDECGQCKESEVMIPLTQISQKHGQVILAGDPHQLQPMVMNRLAGDLGLKLSFLERILQRAPYRKNNLRFPDTNGYDARLVTKLIYNYRALPSILKVYNDLFYDSELLPMISVTSSAEADTLIGLQNILPSADKRPPTHGSFFYGIRGENKQESDSPSWYNPMEARHIFIMTVNLYRHNIPVDKIGIITPYIKQVKHIRNLFIAADIAVPKIGTVEEFQGQERAIILISTVRSAKQQLVTDSRFALGFVGSPKRMNVAISRARCLNIIFGNPHLLVLDDCWRNLIKYCLDNEAYGGCDLPESLENADNG